MEGMILLEHANASGLRVQVSGDELILTGPSSCNELAEKILREKPSVLAALRERDAMARAAAWNRLAGERWGDASRSAGIVIPAEGWRYEIAHWPVDKWLAWHRRSTEILPVRTKVAEIEAADLQAYNELVSFADAAAPVPERPRVKSPELPILPPVLT